MAIIKCPECGKEISSRAEKCVGCGLPLSEIFICPECNNVSLTENGGKCPSCGCPQASTVAQPVVSAPVVTQTVENIEVQKTVKTADDALNEMITFIEEYQKFPVGIILMKCRNGQPITDYNWTKGARDGMIIPDNEDIYFIYTSNLLKKCCTENSRGFAITNGGIYISDMNTTKSIRLTNLKHVDKKLYETVHANIGGIVIKARTEMTASLILEFISKISDIWKDVEV